MKLILPARVLLRVAVVCLFALLSPAWAEDNDEASHCLKGQEAIEQTIEHCTRAIDAKSLGEEVRANCLTRRALAYMSKGELDRASTDVDAAIGLNPDSFWAYNSRGVVWMQKGDVTRAIADYDHAISLKPDYAFSLSNRGNAWLAKGDADRAIADLKAAISLAPAHVELSFTGRGKALMAKGDFEAAVADFDAALKANPTYANALSGRAYARFAQGRFEAAATDFALERKLRPDAENAVGLFLAQARSGNKDASAALAETAKGADAEKGLPPAVVLFLGRVTPEQVLQAVVDRNPNTQRERTCKANFHVGEWYLLKKDVVQAKSYLKQAADHCDKNLMESSSAVAELGRLK